MLPPATTVNVTLLLGATVWFCGCATMNGAVGGIGGHQPIGFCPGQHAGARAGRWAGDDGLKLSRVIRV